MPVGSLQSTPVPSIPAIASSQPSSSLYRVSIKRFLSFVAKTYSPSDDLLDIFIRICRILFDFAQWFLVIVVMSYVAHVSHSRIVFWISLLLMPIWYCTGLFMSMIPFEFMMFLILKRRPTSVTYKIFMIIAFNAASILSAFIVLPHIFTIIQAFTIVQCLSR